MGGQLVAVPRAWAGKKKGFLRAAHVMQMAARETGFGAVEQYMHAGKLLALELLVRTASDMGGPARDFLCLRRS